MKSSDPATPSKFGTCTWRPISLLNVDTKILSKALSTRIEKVVGSVIESDQTAYVSGRYIGESV